MISSYVIEPYPSFSCNLFTAGSLSYVIVSLVALSYTEEHRLPTATGMFVGIGLMYTTGMALSLLMGAESLKEGARSRCLPLAPRPSCLTILTS
jgi:zinc transporter, ZIP family